MRAPLTSLFTLVALTVAGCFASVDLTDLAPLEAAPAITRLTTAHRGSLHHDQPDNSIPAITEAIAANVPLLEVDVRRSDSGELFLFHDSRVSFGNSFGACSLRLRRVASLSASERQQVFLNKARSITIPNLSEALMAVKNSQSRLQLDIKQESDDLVRAVINEVTRYHAEKDIVLQLRAPSRIQMVRQEYPSIAILARCKNQDQVSAAIKAKVQFIELERWISRAAIDAAHAANIPVLLNIAHPSIDTEAAHRYFRSRGIDIIMTDHASDW